MPNTRSAAKAMRASVRKRLRNKSTKSALKTFISKAERLIAGDQIEAAGAAVVQAVSALDEAAQKGIIHANNAARRKSRLMKKLGQAQEAAAAAAAAAAVAAAAAAAAAAPEPEPAAPKRRTRRTAKPQA